MVTEFNIRDIATNVTDATPATHAPTSADKLWENLKYFLEIIVPIADMLRDFGVFRPKIEVPDNAPLQDKLLGLTGRQP